MEKDIINIPSRKRSRIRDSKDALEIIKYCSEDLSPEKVGERIFSIRKAHSLRQEDMALQLNLSVSGLRRLEAGLSFPNGLTLVKLHEQFGVDILWLLYGTHSSHMDILTLLSAEDDSVKFDIFTRLFSYFSSHDCKSFIPSHGRCAGVEHFSEWDGTFYKPIPSANTSSPILGEKQYQEGVSFEGKEGKYSKEYLDTHVPELSETLLRLKDILQ